MTSQAKCAIHFSTGSGALPQATLVDQITEYMAENRIAQDDVALGVIESLQQQPGFTFETFTTFVELHPEKFNWLQGAKKFDLLTLVRRATKEDLARLRQRYGSAPIDQALATLAKRIHHATEQIEDKRAAEGVSNKHSSYTAEDALADKQRREGEMQKSPLHKLQQAQQKRECESQVSSFRVCIGGGRTDWGSTLEGRQVLQQRFDDGVAAGKPWAALREELRAKSNELAGM